MFPILGYANKLVIGNTSGRAKMGSKDQYTQAATLCAESLHAIRTVRAVQGEHSLAGLYRDLLAAPAEAELKTAPTVGVGYGIAASLAQGPFLVLFSYGSPGLSSKPTQQTINKQD